MSRGPVDETADPDAPDDDSFFHVNFAYNMGQLDDEQYDALADAYGAG